MRRRFPASPSRRARRRPIQMAPGVRRARRPRPLPASSFHPSGCWRGWDWVARIWRSRRRSPVTPASGKSPTGLFFPVDAIHVLSASVWVGGIACLLLALPAATRRLQEGERTQLLLGSLRRFSPFALAAVIAIAATGVIQAYIDVRSIHGLLHTTYGALIIAKTALLGALIVLGWLNRERLIPALRRIAAAAGPPGGAGVVARRTCAGSSS